jgi:glutamate decarboxylase
MLADLWNAPHAAHAIGTATTGSSEAIQLGGLAMKRIWQEKRKAAGKSIHEPGPNIVMGTYVWHRIKVFFFSKFIH